MAIEPRAVTDAERWFRERLCAHARARRAVRDAQRRACGAYVHGPDDAPEPERIGLPGEFLFTRGAYPLMYRGRLWTMRQSAGFGSPEETNERFRFLLDHGQTALSDRLRPADATRT